MISKFFSRLAFWLAIRRRIRLFLPYAPLYVAIIIFVDTHTTNATPIGKDARNYTHQRLTWNGTTADSCGTRTQHYSLERAVSLPIRRRSLVAGYYDWWDRNSAEFLSRYTDYNSFFTFITSIFEVWFSQMSRPGLEPGMPLGHGFMLHPRIELGIYMFEILDCFHSYKISYWNQSAAIPIPLTDPYLLFL